MKRGLDSRSIESRRAMFSSQRMTSRLPFFLLALVGALCLLSGSAVAQLDGGGTIEDLQNLQDAGDTGDGSTGGGDGELDTVEPVRIGLEIENVRNQGFVGPSAPLLEDNGFVGPASENNPLDGIGEGRFAGGGVNEGLGGRTATTSSAELQDNGFTVVRQSLRAKLVPAFATRQTPGWVAESRFHSRISRQPVVRDLGAGVTVTVRNRRAILSGAFHSEAERDVIKRQLRLEPGIYGIDDQTSILN